jgi:hypothetical protein
MGSVIWEAILSAAGGALILFSIALFIVAIYPFDILTVKTPLKVLSHTVEQGDCVFVIMDFDQRMEGPSTITAQVIIEEKDDHIIIASQQLGMRLPAGKHLTEVGFTLPRNITSPAGKTTFKAKMEITSRYEVFGFRNIDITYCTEDFTIVPRTY